MFTIPSHGWFMALLNQKTSKKIPLHHHQTTIKTPSFHGFPGLPRVCVLPLHMNSIHPAFRRPAAAQGRAQRQLPGLPGRGLRGRQSAQGEDQKGRQAGGDHRQTGQGLGGVEDFVFWIIYHSERDDNH